MYIDDPFASFLDIPPNPELHQECIEAYKNSPKTFASNIASVNKGRKFPDRAKPTSGIGKEHYRAKRIICNETGCIYDTMMDAAKAHNIYYGTISRWCRGKVKATKNSQFNGFTFRYAD